MRRPEGKPGEPSRRDATPALSNLGRHTPTDLQSAASPCCPTVLTTLSRSLLRSIVTPDRPAQPRARRGRDRASVLCICSCRRPVHRPSDGGIASRLPRLPPTIEAHLDTRPGRCVPRRSASPGRVSIPQRRSQSRSAEGALRGRGAAAQRAPVISLSPPG
jgi:hypothetical protein